MARVKRFDMGFVLAGKKFPILFAATRYTDAAFAALKESVRRHGVLVPVLVDESNGIIDGVVRVRACWELGRDVPVEVVAGLTHAEKAALRERSNQQSLKTVG